jgi:hypothetical protein
MASWHVNEGLAVLIRQVKAMWLGIVIYTIGDASHSARKSDHNPNSAGRVNAADFMIRGVFTKALAKILVAWLIRDSRTKYVIYNRQIWQDGGWNDYTGSDPHTDHVHLSVKDSAHKNTSEWKLKQMAHTFKEVNGFKLPVLKEGMHDADYAGYDYIWRVQKIVGVKADKDYGPVTREAVKDWFGGKINGKTIDLDQWVSLYGLSTV